MNTKKTITVKEIRNIYFKENNGKYTNIKGGYYNKSNADEANEEKSKMLTKGFCCVTEQTWKEKKMFLKAEY